MPRPRILAALLLLVLAPFASAQDARSNVLFVAVDDLRPWVGAYGHPDAVTPHIDRLAGSGTRFDRAYANVPVCGASRATVLSGLRVRPNLWRADRVERPFVSLPAHLGAAGYETVSLGKVLHHLDDLAGDWTTPPWRSGEMYHGTHDWAGYNHYGVWQSPSSAAHVNPASGRGPYAEAADVPDEAYQDGQVAAQAVGELERLAGGDAPFFLAVGFWRPHLPFNAPKRYWDLYDRAELDAVAHTDRHVGCLGHRCDRRGETRLGFGVWCVCWPPCERVRLRRLQLFGPRDGSRRLQAVTRVVHPRIKRVVHTFERSCERRGLGGQHERVGALRRGL